MKINKTIAIGILLFGLLIGGLGAGVFLSQRPISVNAAPAVQQATPCPDGDNVQDEAQNEADDTDKDTGCDKNESDEANEANDSNEADSVDKADEDGASLQGQTAITTEQAQATAEAANPGTKTLAVELDRENENGGAVIYEVELDNGLDVQVDAVNGNILKTDQRDAN